MRHIRTALSLSLCSLIISGCVIPADSGHGKVGLAGSIEAPSAQRPQSVEITVSPLYGIDRLDRLLGVSQGTGPFDHLTKTDFVTANSSGAFTAMFDTWYPFGIWIIPPLGAIPNHPPPPLFVIRFPETLEETYFVWLEDGKFEYEIYDTNTRLKKAPQESHWRIEGQKYEASEYPDQEKSGVKEIWYMHVKLIWNQANKLDSAA